MSQDPFQPLVEELLRSRGAVLIRKKKHPVWKLRDGRKWVTPATASCGAAWENNYNDLRARLGIKASDKTQSDFDHKKKEEREEKHKDTHSYLLEKPTHEVLPTPPKPPSKREREILEVYHQRVKEEEAKRKDKEIFMILNQAPIVRHRGSGAHPGSKSSKAYTFTPEVLAQANYLLHTEGEESSKRYLDGFRFGIQLPLCTPETKKEEETSMTTAPEPQPVRMVGGGPIQEMLEVERGKIRHYRKVIADAEIELLRAQKTVEQLEAVHTTLTASKETIKAMTTETIPASTNGNGHHDPNQMREMRPRGYWLRTMTEVIETSPTSLSSAALQHELRKVANCSKSSAYQAIHQLKHSGHIFVDEEGFYRLAKVAPVGGDK